jgi:ATP-dependent RNA helicase DeaD
MLNTIEKATKQKIELMELPTTEMINDNRIARFQQRITDTLAVEDLGLFYQIIEQYRQEHNVPAIEIASALAKMAQGKTPLLLTNRSHHNAPMRYEEPSRSKKRFSERIKEAIKPEEGMERYRIEVGKRLDTKPANIVGAIANEAGIDSDFIGKIKIYDDYSTVDLPQGIPDDIMRMLKKVRVSGERLNISKMTDYAGEEGRKKRQKRKKRDKKRKKS